jgi:hypothetical protein
VFSVLYHFWVVTFVAFNGDDLRELAAQFLTLADKQGATAPLMVGHRMMGIIKLFTGDVASALAHFDQSRGLDDPAEHHPLATRFGHDTRLAVLCWRAFASWVLGYPDKAVAYTNHALKDAREISPTFCRNDAAANALLDELVVLAEEKGAFF